MKLIPYFRNDDGGQLPKQITCCNKNYLEERVAGQWILLAGDLSPIGLPEKPRLDLLSSNTIYCRCKYVVNRPREGSK